MVVDARGALRGGEQILVNGYRNAHTGRIRPEKRVFNAEFVMRVVFTSGPATEMLIAVGSVILFGAVTSTISRLPAMPRATGSKVDEALGEVAG